METVIDKCIVCTIFTVSSAVYNTRFKRNVDMKFPSWTDLHGRKTTFHMVFASRRQRGDSCTRLPTSVIRYSWCMQMELRDPSSGEADV